MVARSIGSRAQVIDLMDASKASLVHPGGRPAAATEGQPAGTRRPAAIPRRRATKK